MSKRSYIIRLDKSNPNSYRSLGATSKETIASYIIDYETFSMPGSPTYSSKLIKRAIEDRKIISPGKYLVIHPDGPYSNAVEFEVEEEINPKPPLRIKK